MNLSIKNVPEPWVDRLRKRAARRHRSLQGELLTIIETVVREDDLPDLDALSRKIKALGLPSVDEATAMIRADRDAR